MAGERSAGVGWVGMLLLLCNSVYIFAQEPETIPSAAEENRLENQVEQMESVPEDDAQWQQLNGYTRHKIQLNTADAAALQSLGLLTPLQVNSFLAYRRQLGKLLSIYELQAIPGFEPEVIRAILPYVTVGNDLQPHYSLRDLTRLGDHALLLRYGRQLETSRGYASTDTGSPHYLGSPDRLFLRYRYNFPRHMSWGVVMEKDAGEQFFKGAQRRGFDFYSVHLFIKDRGHIKALALGDFTVNMGQGLLNWQSLALGKGPAVMQVKREGELLRPYSSAGEFYFFRGAGITLRQGGWESTGFVSWRGLDGNVTEMDTLETMQYITAMVSSGYHRSAAEAAKRNAVKQFTAGGNIALIKPNLRIGVNVIHHTFSAPLQQKTAPYNLFAFSGKQLTNASVDYAVAWKNVHFFGEMAMSGNNRPAMVHGLLASVARQVDISLLYRYYHRAYQSLYANAFGEYYRPANETGLYMAVSLKVSARLKLDAYADLFRFPWLQYRASAPGSGKEFLLAMTYTPDKHTEAFIRYSYISRLQNAAQGSDFIAPLENVVKRNWRCQVALQPAERLSVKARMDVNSYGSGAVRQQGFLVFQELAWRCRAWPLQLSGRFSRFVTGGTESRIYAVETGMLYEYAVSQLYGRGWQYQFRVRWNARRKLSVWIRFQQAVYEDVSSVGSGWDQVAGNRKSMVQVQLQQLF